MSNLPSLSSIVKTEYGNGRIGSYDMVDGVRYVKVFVSDGPVWLRETEVVTL